MYANNTFIVITVEFESDRFTGFESSGFIGVNVTLNGLSTTPISLLVTTTEWTATGKQLDEDLYIYT